MIEIPKLVLLAVAFIAVWYAMRWLNRPPPRVSAAARRRTAAPGGRARVEAEDLVSCGVCGTYMALNARGCGKAGCPRPG